MYKKYNKFVIITDDGIESENTIILYKTLKKFGKNVILYVTKQKTSAKSNAISLKPFQIERSNDNIRIIDGFPCDCLLYSILTAERNDSDLLYIFGINEHNHFGYSTYVGSTTSLLLLAKHFRIPAISISSEIPLNEYYMSIMINEISKRINSEIYHSFNINKLTPKFHDAMISRELLDTHQPLITDRGAYMCITYNTKFETNNSWLDTYYQTKKENYVVSI